ncbi:hypothetical protein B4W72_12030 [Staphylococcus delphini]|uniref:hypothetical protein n=1 Tax=Staphylococcus delphini TaxID=53344 RepID=UPI000BBB7A67|nr:hypothetical protein [Staphylococcus delphini]PCF70719.1 hypothetical protein B4W72_12030 [Staphylococcus delphini]
MKIKTRKEMNLHELIKWAWENDVKGKTFISKRGKKVKFYSEGPFNVLEPIWPHDVFTVEVEEEITEKTIIPNLLETYQFNGISVLELRKDKSIKDLLDSYDYEAVTIKAFHIINDDSTHTLIWKDGELV